MDVVERTCTTSDDPGEPGWVSCVGKSLRANLRFLLGKQDPASDTASAPDSAASINNRNLGDNKIAASLLAIHPIHLMLIL